MSDPKMVSEREAVERERRAYVDGRFDGREGAASRSDMQWFQHVAESKYKLPKVERPRIVSITGGWRYRVGANGRVEYAHREGDDWTPTFLSAADYAAVGTLKDRPTELVEEDA